MGKDISAAREFLATVFHAHDPGDGGHVLIWTLPEKTSFFCNEIDEAVEKIKQANGSDVYVGVGLARNALGPDRRGDVNNICALPGLVLDIDVAGPEKKKPAFKTKKEALDFVHRLPLRPTIIVDSGGGLHCWNIFNEPIEINDAKSRAEAIKLTKAWNIYAQREAIKLGVTLDSVYDLTRVLRVPGTHNYKYGKPGRPVKLIEIDPKRLYNPDDFDIYLDSINTDSSEVNQIDGLILSPDRQPPADKLAALICNSKAFRETWERTRTDMEDTSPSAWDMALANMAAQAEWSEQEIADLLIANRVKHNEKLKIRETYINKTIAKAMSAVQSERKATASISSIISVIETAKKNPFDTAELDPKSEEYLSAFRVLRHTLSLPIVKLVKYGRTLKATYSALFVSPTLLQQGDLDAEELADRLTIEGPQKPSDVLTQTFDSVDEFESQKIWANVASTIFRSDPMPLKKEAWMKVTKIMRHLLTEMNATEFDMVAEIMDIVSLFIGKSMPPRIEDAVDLKAPFIADIAQTPHVMISLAELRAFARQTRTGYFSPQKLGAHLSVAGFRAHTVRDPRSKKQMRVWCIPLKELSWLIDEP